MKKYTNYTSGDRGVTVKAKGEDGKASSETVWIAPGQTVEIDPKTIIDPLPDLGAKPQDEDAATEIDALRAENADLKAMQEDGGFDQ